MLMCSGDRFVFFGDSITEADPGYTRLLAAMVGVRHPDLAIDWIYRGAGGDTVLDLLARLDHDVLAAEPTWVAVSVGMNDVWHRREGRGGVPLGTFRTAYRELLRRLRSRDILIVCLTPTVLGEDRNSDANRELGRAAAVIGAEALAAGARVADMHQAFLPILGHRRLTMDGVHMNLLGNVLMADTLYDALREPRAL